MASKIKVLNIGYGLGGYGTERTLFVYAKYLDRSRFDVRVHGLGKRAGDNVKIYQDASLPFSESDDLTEVLATFRPDMCISIVAAGKIPEHIEAIKAAGVKTPIETNVFGRPNPHPRCSSSIVIFS